MRKIPFGLCAIVLVGVAAVSLSPAQARPQCLSHYDEVDAVYDEELAALSLHIAVVDYILERGLANQQTTRKDAMLALANLEAVSREARAKLSRCDWE